MILKSAFILLVGVTMTSLAQNCGSGPPRGAHPKSCCDTPKLMDKSVMDSCFNKLGIRPFGPPGGPPGGPPNRFKRHPPGPGSECAMECVFTELKLLNQGTIDTQAAIAISKDLIGNDNDWPSVISAGITFCAAEAQKNQDKFAAALNGKTPDGTTVCSGYSGFFAGCMHSYEIANCPDSKYTASTGCDEIKSYFKKCPTPPIF